MSRLPPSDHACAQLLHRTIRKGTLELYRILGAGSYGVVYKAIDRVLLEQGIYRAYAVKCMMRPLNLPQKQFQAREFMLQTRVHSHPHIITVHDVVVEGDFVFIIMDFCGSGDLYEAITQRSLYVDNLPLAKSVFLQILDAVEFCHHRGVYHRDLKPENIMCRQSGRVALIGDFGLATNEPRSIEYGFGSHAHMGPEVHKQSLFRIHGHPYSTRENDVWALGVIFFNMTTGKSLWHRAELEDEEFLKFITTPNYFRDNFSVSTAFQSLLARVFELDPMLRITIPEFREAVMELGSTRMSDMEWMRAQAARAHLHERRRRPMDSLHPLTMPADKLVARPPLVTLPIEIKPDGQPELIAAPYKDEAFWQGANTIPVDMDAFLQDSDEDEPQANEPPSIRLIPQQQPVHSPQLPSLEPIARSCTHAHLLTHHTLTPPQIIISTDSNSASSDSDSSLATADTGSSSSNSSGDNRPKTPEPIFEDDVVFIGHPALFPREHVVFGVQGVAPVKLMEKRKKNKPIDRFFKTLALKVQALQA